MFALIVGQVDWNSAAVLCVMLITVCIFSTSYVTTHRSRKQLDQDFELAKIRQKDSQAVALATEQRARDLGIAEIQSKNQIEVARIESGTITSHARTVGNGEG